MAGRIVVDGEPAPRNWDRFALEFEDGGRLALRDKRRLSRAVLEPDYSHVGPDAAEITRATFRKRVGRGTAPLKARLLDQGVLAGIGNLLADESLWRARLSPLPPRGRALRGGARPPAPGAARRHARRDPQRRRAHGRLIPHRRRGRALPALLHQLERGTVGGRTTFWCPRCQP